MKFVLLLLKCLSLLLVVDCVYHSSADYRRSVLRDLLTSLTNPSRNQETLNFTAYLSYANNPFGSSTVIQYKRNMLNFSVDPHVLENSIIPGGPEIISAQESRSKRGVVHLYNMVNCATGCNPLIYKGYGCYCGFLGSGAVVDGIDRCCKLHDWCYNNAKCHPFLEYFVPYYWICFRNRPLCAIGENPWDYNSSPCAQNLCECDRRLSECLRRYPCPSSRALCTTSSTRLLQNILMNF